MSTMVVTVVSGDEGWRRSLESGLASVGFVPLDIYDDDSVAGRRAPPIALLIDAVDDPYDAVDLASWLTIILADRCPPLVCLGDPKGGCDEELFAGHAARPDDPAELLRELEHLVPRIAGMASGFVTKSGEHPFDDEKTG